MAEAYAFEFEGQEYRINRLMLSEARAIQKATGRTIGQFDEAMADGDVDCLAALVWVARKRQDPKLRFEDIDGDLLSFKPLPTAGADEREPDSTDEAPEASGADDRPLPSGSPNEQPIPAGL